MLTAPRSFVGHSGWSPSSCCLSAEYQQDQLREAVRLAPQDAYLFNTTIGENVKLGRPEADRERITDALAEAGLEDWINSLPEGIDSPVGEEGSKVSGGQRQRIATAREVRDALHNILLATP